MRKFLYHFTLIILLLIFLICGWNLSSYLWEGHKTQNRYEDLAQIVEQARPKETQVPTAPASDVSESETSPSEATEVQEEATILEEYQALYEQNSHLAGWIRIEDTVIDYPVMQTPEDPEYYLHRDFDKNDNARGCLFADGSCDTENSDNVVIYGHHMNDGSMFASLVKYSDRNYWEAHQQIRFDTLTQRRTYEIFAVFRTTASVGQGFPYHRFIDAVDQTEFDNYVANCKSLALYDTGIVPEFGDKLICLSTCEYTRENGRFVVMGVYRPE